VGPHISYLTLRYKNNVQKFGAKMYAVLLLLPDLRYLQVFFKFRGFYKLIKIYTADSGLADACSTLADSRLSGLTLPYGWSLSGITEPISC